MKVSKARIGTEYVLILINDAKLKVKYLGYIPTMKKHSFKAATGIIVYPVNEIKELVEYDTIRGTSKSIIKGNT